MYIGTKNKYDLHIIYFHLFLFFKEKNEKHIRKWYADNHRHIFEALVLMLSKNNSIYTHTRVIILSTDPTSDQ